MRPRGIPAENPNVVEMIGRSLIASMRPRGIPAENVTGCWRWASSHGSFNEAAGNTRGKLSAVNLLSVLYDWLNEAAGNTRGKRRS